MEVHAAPAAAKRAWSYLRAVFFMARKGVLSNKRKLFISVHLLMNRRRNKQTVANLLYSHHHHHHGNALRRRDYEFSCSNSPDVPPGSFSFFSHSSSSRRRLAYFPCLGAVVSEKEEEDVASSQPLARIEYHAGASPPAPSSLAPGDQEYSAAPGAFSVRVSNYSSEDEGAGRSDTVDDDAEEFIRRFYEQLRRQNQIAMLPYHLQESAAA